MKKRFIYCLSLILYAVLNLVLLSHHEAWRDEAQAWTIARNLNLHEIINLLPTEGHFLPFFLILKIWYKLGGMFAGIGLISLVIMTITVGLFFFNAPFPVWIKELIAFSPVFFYYNAVICRCYSIVSLALVLTAITRKKKREHYLAYCLSIAFLIQTHILVVPLAMMLCAELMVSIIAGDTRKKQMAEACIPLGSMIAAFLEVYQKNNTAYITFDSVLNNFATAEQNALRENLNTIISWVYGNGRIYTIVLVLLAFVVVMAACLQIVWIIKHRGNISREMVVCGFGIVGYLVIVAFVRACAHIQMALVFYMILLFAIWIIEDAQNEEELDDAKDSDSSALIPETIIKSAITASLVLIVIASYKHEMSDIRFDYYNNYSNSKAMASKMIDYLPKESVVFIRQEDYKISAPYAYIMDRRDDIVFWDADENAEFKCIIWGKTYQPRVLSVLSIDPKRNYYYLCSTKDDTPGTFPDLLAEDENTWGENYYLYSLP